MVIQAIFMNRITRRPERHRPLLIGFWKLVPQDLQKRSKLKNSLGGFHALTKRNWHAHAHCFNWKRQFPVTWTCSDCKTKL
jgi:hypothetical protein